MKIGDRKVLVTGGAGFIGSHLVDRLVKEGAEVVVVDNLRDGRRENLSSSIDEIEFREADVRDQEAIKEIVEEVETIFHLAANANVPNSVENPEYDFETNAGGTFNILRASLDNDLDSIVFASSAAVYGEPKYTPIDEEHPVQPISPYGGSKAAAENIGFSLHETYGVPFTTLRIFNSCGPRQDRYVMYDFLKKLDRNPEELEVLGTGEQVRSFCHVKETADAFVRAAERDTAGDVFNIGTDESITIAELAEKTVEICNLEDKTEIRCTGESWEGDIKRLKPEISKAKRELGFEPSIGLETILIDLKSYLEGGL
ncbi:hypothetical protein AKJ52_00105 [candidate division MSBL1 archaeon SCGC-AAA382C18]|uniref:NAD(P)-binding domain-containing protein n=1 Tax=candidate division MSBL1 archaeon SCGC-AAA382C18 TaxID=1698281 RepID=A0A133VM15_9EURY|nr:hypothetical protein AKJ52_00105 [candidate division MSBL1 archaeon SCGC-AAA382C18]